MRVPAIFWGAGIVSKSVNEIGSTLDLYPTFMSISNISYKDDNDTKFNICNRFEMSINSITPLFLKEC